MNKRRRTKWFKLLPVMLLPILLVSCSVLLIAMDTAEQAGDESNVARTFEIPGDYLLMTYQAAEADGYDFIKLLALSTKAAYNGEYDREVLDTVIERMGDTLDEDEMELYEIYTKCYGELKNSAIPKKTVVRYEDEKGKVKETTKYWSYSHYDDFGAERFYKEERQHYGNDLISDKGTPVVSMTDGYITNKGWNELGGWRIGITDANGTYWYYAHMDHYADDINEGDWIAAGTVIGYVGNTGYGPPGTSGQFVDHLHLQIGIVLDDLKDEYLWINPYPIVVFMEPYRVILKEDE